MGVIVASIPEDEGDDDPQQEINNKEARSFEAFWLGNDRKGIWYTRPYEEADFSRLFDYNSRCCIVPDDEEEEEEE